MGSPILWSEPIISAEAPSSLDDAASVVAIPLLSIRDINTMHNRHGNVKSCVATCRVETE